MSKKFIIPNLIISQMKYDKVIGVHIRDFISVDIKLDGSYTTDFDGDVKTKLADEYIDNINKSLYRWYFTLSSMDWYAHVDGHWLNVSVEELENSRPKVAVDKEINGYMLYYTEGVCKGCAVTEGEEHMKSTAYRRTVKEIKKLAEELGLEL